MGLIILFPVIIITKGITSEFGVPQTTLSFSDFTRKIHRTQQSCYTHFYGLLQKRDTD